MRLHTIRLHILGLVTLAVLPALGLMLYAVADARRNGIAEATASAGGLATLLATQQQRTLDSAQGLLSGLARLPAVRSLDGPACRAALGEVMPSVPFFNNLALSGPDGVVVCNTLAPSRRVRIDDRRYFREAIAHRGFGVGEYQVSRSNNRPSLDFGMAVLGRDGAPRGVVIAGLALSALQRRVEEQALPPGTVATILDARGVRLAARPDASRAGRPMHPALLARIAAAPDGAVEAPDDAGVPRLWAWRAVAHPHGGTAMTVVVGIPISAANAEVAHLLRRALFAYGALGLVVLLAAVLVAERGLVQRLLALRDAAVLLARGDPAAEAIRPGRGELGAVEEAFAEAARSVRRLRTVEDQLRHGQKLEAVGRLAGGVAHDFNNLLTVILSSARFLRETLPPGHEGREDVEEIFAAAERGARLTRHLLAFSRRQELSPAAVELGELVTGLEGMLRRVLGEQIVIATGVAPGGAPVRADRGQLEQVVLNLALNARDAMPEGGHLAITVGPPPPGLLKDDLHLPAGPLVLLAVSDTGVGMSAETARHAFEPFFTTKPEGKGTGLGLATVYGIVTQSGGAVRLETAPGAGTTVRVFLPRADAARPLRAEAPAPAPHRSASATVLLVEDDGAVRALARRVLEAEGYQVLEAARPGEALLRAAGPEKVQLVLSDVMLPETDGVTLARELQTAQPGARVLLMSGAPEAAEAARPLPFLAKPFTPEELLARVRAVLEAPPLQHLK